MSTPIWYVVHTHPNSEYLASEHLRRQGYTTYIPVYEKKRSHARRVDWVKAPLFPRYLFVKNTDQGSAWSPIESTVGVSKLIKFGGTPAEISRKVIDSLKNRENENGIISLFSPFRFKAGDNVTVDDGLFDKKLAKILQFKGYERVVVLMEVMGRQVKVATEINSLIPST